MRLSDIAIIMKIEKEAFPVPWKASAYEYEITKNRLANYQVLTAHFGDQPGQIVGYGGYWRMVDKAHVSTIAVHSHWKGQGLGELLLLNMLLLCYKENAQLATLEVRRSNIVAQSLYKKYLFRVVGERIRYYQKREDALIMTVSPLDAAYKRFLNQQKGRLFVKLIRRKKAATI
jgi:ribosomal-protein-alanine N-acetyltransferase